MTHADPIQFLRKHKLAVESSIDADGRPQCAVVGFALRARRPAMISRA